MSRLLIEDYNNYFITNIDLILIVIIVFAFLYWEFWIKNKLDIDD